MDRGWKCRSMIYISPLQTPIVHVQSFLLLAMAKTIMVNSNETISVDEKVLGKSLSESPIIVPRPLSHGYQQCQFVCWDFVVLWIPHVRELGKRGSLDFKRLPPNASESPPLNGPLLRLTTSRTTTNDAPGNKVLDLASHPDPKSTPRLPSALSLSQSSTTSARWC